MLQLTVDEEGVGCAFVFFLGKDWDEESHSENTILIAGVLWPR